MGSRGFGRGITNNLPASLAARTVSIMTSVGLRQADWYWNRKRTLDKNRTAPNSAQMEQI